MVDVTWWKMLEKAMESAADANHSYGGVAQNSHILQK
jgi:hypothetical protein